MTNQINSLSQDEYKELDFENHNIYKATFKPPESISRMMIPTGSPPDSPSVTSPPDSPSVTSPPDSPSVASPLLPPPPTSYSNVPSPPRDSIVGSGPDLPEPSGSHINTEPPKPYTHEVTYLNRSPDFLKNTYEFFLSGDYSKLV